MSVRYRVMRHDDIPAGLQLCRTSGWNQLARDWELFLQLSPSGCLVAENEGRVVGTVATVRYEDRFAWIGMVLVDPVARGQGIGTTLLERALELLGDLQCIKLDATPAGKPMYSKLGFEEEYVISRLETTVQLNDSRVASVSSLGTDDMSALFNTDREVFGADRSATLRWMREGAPEYARTKSNFGYVLGRHGYTFEHVGPLIADSDDAAKELLLACLKQLEGRRVIVDVPVNQKSWCLWVKSFGFVEQRPLIRMFRGRNLHAGKPDKQFAILGPEFG